MKKYYPIPNWESYGVSKDGFVARIKGGVRGASVGLVLSPYMHKTRGYLMVRLYDRDRRKTFDVHRLVAMTFLGDIPSGMHVCHNNGIKTDCRLSNLRIDTVVSNSNDKILHGRTNKGEKNGKNKYSEDQIKDLKLRILNGETNKSIANNFGMPLSYVRNIRNGYKWKWLEISCKK
jgi:hypothetical protein